MVVANEHEKTAAGRIALRAWEHVFQNETNGCRTHVLNLRDVIEPYVELEIQIEVLKTVQKFGTFKESLDILKKIEDLKREIAARNLA